MRRKTKTARTVQGYMEQLKARSRNFEAKLQYDTPQPAKSNWKLSERKGTRRIKKEEEAVEKKRRRRGRERRLKGRGDGGGKGREKQEEGEGSTQQFQLLNSLVVKENDEADCAGDTSHALKIRSLDLDLCGFGGGSMANELALKSAKTFLSCVPVWHQSALDNGPEAWDYLVEGGSSGSGSSSSSGGSGGGGDGGGDAGGSGADAVAGAGDGGIDSVSGCRSSGRDSYSSSSTIITTISNSISGRSSIGSSRSSSSYSSSVSGSISNTISYLTVK
ncbi:hypothetical protein PoB_003796000 [Plakobranchus ocellatus]|uniref:Uncharacterized protein n=1 Tax=Plakobranchus ocellatus TaxID=259542 RepID=A0AAV4ASZ1_9GAST|nr:hypothetical protein PoB_003796000 [Plakobranchus ocellatus]